ncbi:beta-propeller fold lactonase family protein [Roseisolibacter sp. H3M3-2]|uniref:YVTN family beta-propeller repeat protein n=1 Tax=Roseisolibacter sp. H3M3-2 TaxID=3031323 RepID=UPI0023DBAEC6|nr:beta-propeller fold lactonase family protein [Roseisolibacter sp. H3M3-2]MDF1503447.1 beta-propeller fold lactonase family protein [Roseisolibacter sp. H3M3-2]
MPPLPAVSLPAALLAAVAACGACGPPRDAAPDSVSAPAAAPAGELAYVSNEGSGEVSVIDVAADSVVATIAVGTRPRGIRVTPDGRRVFVALSGSPRCPPTMPDAECEKLGADKSKDGIAEIDAATRRLVRVLPGGSDPEQFDLTPDGARLFVSNEDVGRASIVDVASGAVARSVDVGREPEGVRLAPDARTFYVTSESDDRVTAVDAADGTVRGAVRVGKRPRDIAFLADGRFYVSNEMAGTVSLVEPAGGAEGAAAPRVAATVTLAADASAMGLAVSPDGARLYVATGRGGEVVAVDTRTNAVVGAVKVGTRPWGIALTRDGRKLYAANGPSHDVSVVDVAAMRVVRTIPVGQLAWGVAVGPAPQ